MKWFLDIVKWSILIVVAGIIIYVVYGNLNRYALVGTGDLAAYKMDKKTGEVWFVTRTGQKLVK